MGVNINNDFHNKYLWFVIVWWDYFNSESVLSWVWEFSQFIEWVDKKMWVAISTGFFTVGVSNHNKVVLCNWFFFQHYCVHIHNYVRFLFIEQFIVTIIIAHSQISHRSFIISDQCWIRTFILKVEINDTD